MRPAAGGGARHGEVAMLSCPRSYAAATAAAALLFGCASPINIIKPDTNPNADPVPQVVVSFLSNFNPSLPWHVALDGTDLSGFSPAPAPGVTSVVPVTWAAGSGLKSHQVTASATCGTFCVYNSAVVNFTPPHLFFNGTHSTPSGSGNLKQFQPVAKFVAVQSSRSVAIPVTVVEVSPVKKVRIASTQAGLAGATPGAPLSLTIPANMTKADFWVVGDGLGLYQLQFTAAGVVPGGGGGTIAP
jgi:hypothetical protein